MSLFADDLKIFKKIKSFSDIRILQRALDILFDYCNFFSLKLNTEKCFAITFSRKLLLQFPSTYKISDNFLTKVDTIKDLGVLLDSKLTFSSHIRFCYDKAIKMLGFLFRTCRDFKNVNSFKTVYFSYVRSHLEYATQIWNPSKANVSSDLEKIQRKFVRFLYFKKLIPGSSNPTFHPNRYTYSYHDSLEKLNIQTLSARRKFFDVDLILKTLTNQIISTDFQRFLTFSQKTRALRHHTPFFISITNESPLNRCMKLFNDLKLDLETVSVSPYSRSRHVVLGMLQS